MGTGKGLPHPGKYLVDGKMMTVAEIAQLMDTTVTGLRVRHSRLGVSYQTMVDMYRAGQFGSRKTGIRKPHLIDGRWLSEREIAAELGISKKALANWRITHRKPDGSKPTMEEAIEHFREWNACGHVRSKPKVHRVKGRDMTVAEAAKMLGCTEVALRSSMSWNKESLAAAVKRQERLKARRAEKAIMEILGYGGAKHDG